MIKVHLIQNTINARPYRTVRSGGQSFFNARVPHRGSREQRLPVRYFITAQRAAEAGSLARGYCIRTSS